MFSHRPSGFPALPLPAAITLLDIQRNDLPRHEGKALCISYTLDNMRLHSRKKLRLAASYKYVQSAGKRGYYSDYGFGENLRVWEDGNVDGFFDHGRAVLPVTPENAQDFIHKAVRQAGLPDTNLVFLQYTVHPDIL